MKPWVFVLAALCFASSFEAVPAEAAGPLGERLTRQSDDNGDGYGRLFNNLSCQKLQRLAGGRSGNGEPAYRASYGPAKAQALDIYVPQRPSGPAPIIVMVHGGAWCVGNMGASSVTENKTERWLPKGFLFVSVNYRMLPDNVDVMTEAADVAAAIAYVQNHAAQWKGNPAEIIVMGHSAGAHLVSLLSSNQALAAKSGAHPWLGTVSLDSAALDVPEIMNSQHPVFYDDAFGSDPSFWKKSSPTLQLSHTALPWLGVCSTQRNDSCPQAHAYSDAAAKFGVKASVLEEDMGHRAINKDLGKPGDYTRQVEAFMASLNEDVKNHLK